MKKLEIAKKEFKSGTMRYSKRIKMQISKLIIIVVFVTISTGCQKKETKKEPSAIRVEAADVIKKDVPLYLETFGNVYETSLVQIKPQAQGILLRADVEQGQYIQKGALLYEIDPRPYQAALDQAKATLMKDQANLEIAKITLKRNEDLVKKDFISKLQFEQYQANVHAAEGQVEADKAAVDTAQINLDYCKIYSPISGRVSLYNVYPGNLVVINDQNFLIEIRQITPVDIRFTVPQSGFEELQKHHDINNLSFEVFLPNDLKRPFEGNIYFYDNHVDLLTGTILIKGHIANEDHILWPGEFVIVRLILKEEKNALLVPMAAVQTGQKGSYVYLIQSDMSVALANIITGQRIDNDIIVQSGLKEGDKVVTNGQLNLRFGSKVEIVNK